MSTPDAGARAERFSRDMTVAQIRERTDGVVVVFLESARFYKLPRTNPSFERIFDTLKDAVERQRVLKISLASPEGDVIEDVRS